MIKKRMTALLTAFLLLQTPLTAQAMEYIQTAPGNMVFLDVTDPAGNSVAGVKVTLYNSSGTEIGGILNDNTFFKPSHSTIDGTQIGRPYQYPVPWETFAAHAAPETLHVIHASSNEMMQSISIYKPGSQVWVENQQLSFLEMYSYDASQPTALTVPANQYAVYADAKWANRTVTASVQVNDLVISLKKKSASPASNKAAVAFGQVGLFSQTAPISGTLAGWDGRRGTTSSPELSSSATEYVLCRMPLYQLCPEFRENGTFSDAMSIYDLRKDTEYTSCLLVIQSGAVLNLVIPDDNGYVEFYLDKSSREFDLDFSAEFDCDEEGVYHQAGCNASGYAIVPKKYVIEPVFLPDDEVILTQVPAGTYTLTYENIPKGYAPPKTKTLTVTNSMDVQYLRLMLEDAAALGDVNSDKQVNAADAAQLLRAASAIGSGGTSGLTADLESAADVNQDGTFNAVDAALILQYAAYVGSGGTLTLDAFLAERTTS